MITLCRQLERRWPLPFGTAGKLSLMIQSLLSPVKDFQTWKSVPNPQALTLDLHVEKAKDESSV